MKLQYEKVYKTNSSLITRFGYYCVAEYIDEANAKNVSNKNNKFERNICHRVHREKEKQKEKSYN